MPTISLRQMRSGQKGRVVKLNGGGEVARRLRDMGLVTGTDITVQGRAPLYDPVHIRLRGGDLTLRNSEADHIEVEVADDGAE